MNARLLLLGLWLLYFVLSISSYAEEYSDFDEMEEDAGKNPSEDRRKLLHPRVINEKDLNMLKSLKPLKQDYDYIVFWRPQKVGSSTLLSILISYAYRYNLLNKRKASPNSFCRIIGRCALENGQNLTKHMEDRLREYVSQTLPGNAARGKTPLSMNQKKMEEASLSIPYRMVLTHELCALESEYIQAHLSCAFEKPSHGIIHDAFSWFNGDQATYSHNVKQLFLVREPLSRAISIYYFWGELSKMALENKMPVKLAKPLKNASQAAIEANRNEPPQRRALRKQPRLGKTNFNRTVEKGLFRYHGVETAVPPLEYALDFANKFPYRKGMPGPSFTWSAFANSYEEAIDLIHSNKMLTLVLDRLDESLVVAVHYLNWSLADAVVTMQRKSLSKHPKYTEWPSESIALLKKKLLFHGEFLVYKAGLQQLNRRIQMLKDEGIDFDMELDLLKRLRKRVSKICHNINYLEHYRKELHYQQLLLYTENKLRDVDDIYSDKGHMFSLNREIIGTFDVCGNCEAHAILHGMKLGLANSVENSTTLFQLNEKYRQGKIDFLKCPLRK